MQLKRSLFSPHGRKLIAGAFAINLMAVLWVSYSLSNSRAIYEANAVATTRNMAVALDQSLSASVHAIDLTLLASKDLMEDRLRQDGRLNLFEINAHLSRVQSRLPFVYGIRATDARGTVLYGSDVDPNAKISWADRDFFATLRHDRESHLTVTDPIYGKVTKRWVLSFIRRYNDRDGNFAGVISASIPVEYFDAMLATLDVGPSGVALLRDSKLGLIARFPKTDSPSGRLGAKGFSPELMQAIDSGVTISTYHSKNTADGIERTNTYRRLAGAPFHLVAGLGTHDYLAPWILERNKSVAGLLVLLVASVCATWLLNRSNARSMAAQRRTDSILRGASDGIHLVDRGGNLLLANDSFYRMLGRERNASLSLRVGDWDASLTEAQIHAALENASATHEQILIQTVHRRLDGSTFPVEVSITAQTYDDHEVLFCSSRDISARLAAEAKAHQAQETMLTAIDAVDEAFVIYDENDCMVYCNQKYRHLYASTADLIVYGESFENIVRQGAQRGIYLEAIGRIDEFVAERVAAHQSGNHQVVTHLDDGRVMRVLDRKLSNGYIVGFRIDVTELDRAKSRAEQLAISKSQFLANMSHEIRTPMNAVLGMLTLLESTELNARQRDYASKADRAAQSLLALLNDILDFSKVDAGKMTLESLPFSLDTLLRNLSVVLASNIKSKDIEVLFDVDPQVPAILLGDVTRLQQVMINLGSNAVKFTEQGQVVISLQCKQVSPRSARLEFAVQDSGIGIAPEHQTHIFSGFSQAEASTTRRFGGTGLGLAISKSLIELMGGAIALRSAPGEGSTFSFEIEFPIPADIPPELQVAVAAPPAAQRVLVVDDNPVAGRLLQKAVNGLGWACEWAASGQAALEKIRGEWAAPDGVFPYTLVLMNWQMPHMDGWQACQAIRTLSDACPGAKPAVIMLSDNGRQGLALRSAQEQSLIDGFLVKPVTASMLLEAVVDAGSDNPKLRSATAGRFSKRQLAGMRVLVVEDNLLNQQVADELLAAEGAIVSLAANGQLGVDAVRTAAPQFDAVLMDVQMPVLDGYGATHAIREDLGLVGLPIIAMTANALASDREACLAAGMNEHIGKPFDMAKLVSLLIRMTGFHATAEVYQAPAPATDPERPVVAVPGLDLQTALSRMAGMQSLYVRTARDFIQIMDTAIPELQLVLRAQDKKKAMMQLHTLKGNAGTLGASELAEKAAQLEKLCSMDGGLDQCVERLPAFEGVMRAAQQRLTEAIALLDNKPAPSKPDATGAPQVGQAARDALQRIATLARASDMDVLQAYVDVRDLLCAFPARFVDDLDVALQGLQFDATAAQCEAMLAKLDAGRRAD